MRRALIILLIAAVYVGCAPRVAPVRVNPPQTLPAGAASGVLRVAVSGEEDARLVERILVGRPIIGGEAALAEGTGEERDGCSRWKVRPSWVGDDGRPIDPRVLAEFLERVEDPGARWLLSPLAATRAFADGPVLELCPARRVPDLDSRFADPALWFAEPSSWSGTLAGPGSYRSAAPGRFVRRPGSPAPYEEVALVRGDAAMLLRLGEADFGIVRGEAAAGLDALPDTRSRREPLRARSYFLWFDAKRRWVNDPRLRRWIAGEIDRAALADELFDGHATPAGTPSGREYLPDPQERRPLAADSRPRLAMSYAGDDPAAETLALRLRADWAARGITVDCRADAADADVVLGYHEPLLGDPVLDWATALARLDPRLEPLLDRFDQASRWPAGGRRDASLVAVEEPLLDSGVLVPLVRVDAWSVTRGPFRLGADDDDRPWPTRWLWSR